MHGRRAPAASAGPPAGVRPAVAAAPPANPAPVSMVRFSPTAVERQMEEEFAQVVAICHGKGLCCNAMGHCMLMAAFFLQTSSDMPSSNPHQRDSKPSKQI
jgi:hypothetical protein